MHQAKMPPPPCMRTRMNAHGRMQVCFLPLFQQSSLENNGAHTHLWIPVDTGTVIPNQVARYADTWMRRCALCPALPVNMILARNSFNTRVPLGIHLQVITAAVRAHGAHTTVAWLIQFWNLIPPLLYDHDPIFCIVFCPIVRESQKFWSLEKTTTDDRRPTTDDRRPTTHTPTRCTVIYEYFKLPTF